MPATTLAFLLCGLLLVPGPGAAQVLPGADAVAGAKPNIVVVMLDDIAYEPTQRLIERTPTLQRIFGRNGLRFTNVYGNDPLCCPGRANFLSGLYSRNHGQIDLDGRRFDPRGSIAARLRQAGYWTVLSGKYLNNFPKIVDKTPAGWDFTAITSGGYSSGTGFWLNGVKTTPAKSYQADTVKKYAVDGMRKASATKPVFVWASFYAPHHRPTTWLPKPAARHVGDTRCGGIGRYASPAYNEADVSDKPAHIQGLPEITKWPEGWPLKKACEALLSVDEAVARIESELRMQGRLDNTIWVLTADNGMTWGDHRVKFKRKPYATHMPLYVSGPGIAAGVNTEFLSNVDIAPTLASLGGTSMGPYPSYSGPPDGHSFAPLLHGRPWSQPRSSLVEEHHFPEGDGMPTWAGIRTTNGRWHYIEYANGEQELYDLDSDPWELENLAGDPASAEQLAVLAAELAATR